MTNFLTRIQALDTSTPQTARIQLELRRVRREKARDAVNSAKRAV